LKQYAAKRASARDCLPPLAWNPIAIIEDNECNVRRRRYDSRSVTWIEDEREEE